MGDFWENHFSGNEKNRLWWVVSPGDSGYMTVKGSQLHNYTRVFKQTERRKLKGRKHRFRLQPVWRIC